MNQPAVPTPLTPRARGMLYLLAVYLAWGSTYLAIRVAVTPGTGMPPFLMGALRTGIGGAIFLLWATLGGHSLRVPPRGVLVLSISGLLMWTGGNATVLWAEQRESSGYAALLVGSMPLWMSLMEAGLDRRRPTLRLVASLLAGFLGLGVLSWPVVRHGAAGDVVATVALLFAPLSWGTGALVQARNKVNVPVVTAAAYQHGAGCLGYLVFTFALGEHLGSPSPAAWGAVAYLVVVGSMVGFLSFLHALQLLPVALVSTYAYVNPIIAVILGALILDEPITGWTVGGSALIILGVVGVFWAKKR